MVQIAKVCDWTILEKEVVIKRRCFKQSITTTDLRCTTILKKYLNYSNACFFAGLYPWEGRHLENSEFGIYLGKTKQWNILGYIGMSFLYFLPQSNSKQEEGRWPTGRILLHARPLPPTLLRTAPSLSSVFPVSKKRIFCVSVSKKRIFFYL